jgi:hypothetical protein
MGDIVSESRELSILKETKASKQLSFKREALKL